MKTITCYLDFISPYAFLAFEDLPRHLLGISHQVVYKPVLFGALLKHHGHKGPAEIAGKREWTYRQVLWLARQQGVRLDMPQAHPFNPLALLRLALACATRGEVSRYVCHTIFQHVWQGGAAADDALRLQTLAQQLAPAQAPDSPEVKAQLRANTQEAIDLGVFGVPTFALDDKLFWGLDALPMLRDDLNQAEGFDALWHAARAVQAGVTR